MKKWITKESKLVQTAHVFKHYQIKRFSEQKNVEGNFDVLTCYNWCNILALDKYGQVVMVKQYRHGIDEITYELAGGAIDPGEDPLAAAKRELCEETGYTSNNWSKLGVVDVNPAFMNNKCYFYLATECEKTDEQNLDELEECEIVLLDKDKIFPKISAGEITHSLVVLAFYLGKDSL